jgi:hypothetical protein
MKDEGMALTRHDMNVLLYRIVSLGGLGVLVAHGSRIEE